jgi:hypothetical protein
VSRWPEVALGEVLTQYREYIDVPEPREYPKLSVRLYGKGVVLDAPADGTTLKMKRHQLAKPGQVILSEIWGKKGAIGFVPPEGTGALCTSHFFLFDVDRSKLDPGWLQAIFTGNYLEPQLEARAFGTTGYASVRPRDLLALGMPLPPIEEQRRVVEKLNRLAYETATANVLRLRADADLLALRRVVYARAEQDALRQGARAPLSSVIDSHDSGWSPQCEEDPAPAGSWGVLKTTCVQWDGFRARANKALRLALVPRPELAVHMGDVLITRAGPVNRVGVACVVPAEHPRLMLSDKIVRLVPVPDVDPDFIVAMLGAPTAQEHLRQSKTGLAASQVNISRSRLLALRVPLPALDVQRRIAGSLRQSLSALNRCAQQRAEGIPAADAVTRAALRLAFD